MNNSKIDLLGCLEIKIKSINKDTFTKLLCKEWTCTTEYNMDQSGRHGYV